LVCVLFSWSSVKIFVKEYLFCFLVMELFLIVVFSTLDLLFFYIFFESILIPMFLMIGIWGSRDRKIRAAYLFFFLYPCRFSFDVSWNLIYLCTNRYN
jgi:NADH-ubiquinone oxidoreductase chain 4